MEINFLDLNNLLTGNIPKTTLSGRILLGVIGNKLPAKDAKAFIYARGFNKIDDPKPSQLKQTIQEVCKLTEEEAEEAIQETLQTILEYDWHEVYDKEYEARQGFHTGCTLKEFDDQFGVRKNFEREAESKTVMSNKPDFDYKSVMYNDEDLGKLLNISKQEVNALMEEAGLQIKPDKAANYYVPTQYGRRKLAPVVRADGKLYWPVTVINYIAHYLMEP